MRIPRLYVDLHLTTGLHCELPQEPAHHLARVLRAQVGDTVTVFNGQGGEFHAVVASLQKTAVTLAIGTHVTVERESPLAITLAQAIAKGERMDYTIQKAVELGVSTIVPLHSQRSVVRLDRQQADKRHVHWRNIIINSCEQCGRNRLPLLQSVSDFPGWLTQPETGLKLLLAPQATVSLAAVTTVPTRVILLVGPEGGFSTDEEAAAREAGYQALNFGPRILRTETAGIAVISALQSRWGDLI